MSEGFPLHAPKLGISHRVHPLLRGNSDSVVINLRFANNVLHNLIPKVMGGKFWVFRVAGPCGFLSLSGMPTVWQLWQNPFVVSLPRSLGAATVYTVPARVPSESLCSFQLKEMPATAGFLPSPGWACPWAPGCKTVSMTSLSPPLSSPSPSPVPACLPFDAWMHGSLRQACMVSRESLVEF